MVPVEVEEVLISSSDSSVDEEEVLDEVHDGKDMFYDLFEDDKLIE